MRAATSGREAQLQDDDRLHFVASTPLVKSWTAAFNPPPPSDTEGGGGLPHMVGDTLEALDSLSILSLSASSESDILSISSLLGKRWRTFQFQFSSTLEAQGLPI